MNCFFNVCRSQSQQTSIFSDFLHCSLWAQPESFCQHGSCSYCWTGRKMFYWSDSFVKSGFLSLHSCSAWRRRRPWQRTWSLRLVTEGEGEQEEWMMAVGGRLRASWCGTPRGTQQETRWVLLNWGHYKSNRNRQGQRKRFVIISWKTKYEWIKKKNACTEGYFNI